MVTTGACESELAQVRSRKKALRATMATNHRWLKDEQTGDESRKKAIRAAMATHVMIAAEAVDGMSRKKTPRAAMVTTA
jgi:hypothetical protein